jgi:hypothetical protein
VKLAPALGNRGAMSKAMVMLAQLADPIPHPRMRVRPGIEPRDPGGAGHLCDIVLRAAESGDDLRRYRT